MIRTKRIQVSAAVLLLCVPFYASAAEPFLLGGLESTDLLEDLRATVVRASDAELFPPCSSPGTLFRWSTDPHGVGGPQLDQPLETDRPDFTEASVTVGRGVAQIEFGYTYTRGQSSDDREQSFGEPLVRYGILANWLELRMATFPVRSQTGRGAGMVADSGVEDLYFGFKVGLTPQAGWLPEMVIMPQINVPSGDDDLSSPGVGPGVCWVYGWELTDEWSMAGQTQWNRSFDDADDSYLEISQSWVVGRSLSDTVGSYFEWYALWPSGAADVQDEHYINGGFTYLISDDVQFDVRAGKGLTDASDDWFVGTGLSVRFR